MPHSKIKLIIIVIVIFALNVIVWYMPLKYKGYAPQPVTRNLIIARNLHLSGKPAIENKMGVFLNSSQIKEQKLFESKSDQLTYLIYAKIYDLIGYYKDNAQYITLIIFALVNALLFLFISHKFKLLIGLLFSGLSILTPVIWQGVLMPGFYEWAILFFVLGFIFYWLKQRTNLIYLFLASIFFSLAILARNAFFISVAAIGLFELINKKSFKRILVLGLPIILIVILPFFISYLQTGSLFVETDSYTSYGHCFPDPYTFHFNRENYIQTRIQSARGDELVCLGEYGHNININEHISVIFDSTKFYIREFLRLISWGGPLILFLIILGLIKLKQKYPKMLKLFYIWFIIWLIGLIILKTSNWNHMLEIWIPMVLLISLGTYYLGQILKNNKIFTLTQKQKFWLLVIGCFLLLGHFVVSSKWMFHEEYNTSNIVPALEGSQIINQANLINTAVIAVDNYSLVMLNYYTDKSIIKFSSQTIEKLIQSGKLKDAFEKFGVTHVMGYNDELNQKIKELNFQIIK